MQLIDINVILLKASNSKTVLYSNTSQIVASKIIIVLNFVKLLNENCVTACDVRSYTITVYI